MKGEKYLYSEKECKKVSEYIDQQFGESIGVLREQESPDIKCDIVVVPPTEEQPYFKLVTLGAGAYKMKEQKNKKSNECDRAEYVIFLPNDWSYDSDREEDFWPIQMLKDVARLALFTDERVDFGHTIQWNEDGSPIVESTRFNSCILLCSIGKDEQEVEPLKLGLFGKKVAFYQVIPLYPEELKYKLEHSLSELIDVFDAGESLVVDSNRKNYCE